MREIIGKDRKKPCFSVCCEKNSPKLWPSLNLQSLQIFCGGILAQLPWDKNQSNDCQCFVHFVPFSNESELATCSSCQNFILCVSEKVIEWEICY